jgi:hypothetical protein
MLIEEQMAPSDNNALIKYVCHACFIFRVHILSLKLNSDIGHSDIYDFKNWIWSWAKQDSLSNKYLH